MKKLRKILFTPIQPIQSQLHLVDAFPPLFLVLCIIGIPLFLIISAASDSIIQSINGVDLPSQRLIELAEKGSPEHMWELSKNYAQQAVVLRKEESAKTNEMTDFDEKRIYWARQAAYAGVFEAQIDMALLYIDDFPLQRNTVQGLAWYRVALDFAPTKKAASLTNQAIEKLEEQMSKAQIEAVDALYSRMIIEVKAATP